MAKRFVLVMSAQCALTSLAYVHQRNWKLALYWLLVAAINTVASTF